MRNILLGYRKPTCWHDWEKVVWKSKWTLWKNSFVQEFLEAKAGVFPCWKAEIFPFCCGHVDQESLKIGPWSLREESKRRLASSKHEFWIWWIQRFKTNWSHRVNDISNTWKAWILPLGVFECFVCVTLTRDCDRAGRDCSLPELWWKRRIAPEQRIDFKKNCYVRIQKGR